MRRQRLATQQTHDQGVRKVDLQCPSLTVTMADTPMALSRLQFKEGIVCLLSELVFIKNISKFKSREAQSLREGA